MPRRNRFRDGLNARDEKTLSRLIDYYGVNMVVEYVGHHFASKSAQQALTGDKTGQRWSARAAECLYAFSQDGLLGVDGREESQPLFDLGFHKFTVRYVPSDDVLNTVAAIREHYSRNPEGK